MPTDRESSDNAQDSTTNLVYGPFGAPPDLNKDSQKNDAKTFADTFRDSYSKMHTEIYTDLYKPMLGNTMTKPDWMKPASNFPKPYDPTPYTSPGDNGRPDAKVPEVPEADEQDRQKPKSWIVPGIFPSATIDRKLTDGAAINPLPKPELVNPIGLLDKLQPRDKPEPAPSSVDNGGLVTREGNRVSVKYPGGTKTRDIIFDSAGKAQEIKTIDANSTMHFIRKGDGWVARIQEMELQMPGKIEANERGEVTFEMEQGIFRREKPDGTNILEKTNVDGARMSFYNNNQVEKLTRKDQSSVQVSQDGKTIVETLANSNRSITWSRQNDGIWTSDSNPPQTRKNLKVESSGNTSWDGPDGLKFVLRGDGSMQVQGDGQGKIQLDEQNRIRSIDYGKKTREFEYFEKTNEIKMTVIKDTEKNSTATFTRENSGSQNWRTDKGEIWTGDIKLGLGGVYSYKPSGQAVQGEDKDGRWYTMWPDSSITRDVIESDGSRLSYDTSGKLKKALAIDGSSADITDNKMIINNPRSGEKITWIREGDSWKSDSPRIQGAKKDLKINEKCEVFFTEDDGSKRSIRPDGKEVVVRKDGVQLELNDQKQIDRIKKGDSVRTIERGSDGAIARVSDKNKDGEHVLVNRQANDGIAAIELGKDGDLLIKRLDGRSKLERADFSSVLRERDGSPLQVTNQRGDTRTYQWESDGTRNVVTAIQDIRKTSKGDITDTWTRKQGTNDFASIDKKGRERIRQDVQLLPDGSGNYTYKSKDGGKDVLARLGGSDGGSELSASVEEARENFLDEIRDKLPEANYKRLQEMMKGFEDRMGDRAYLRKVAGVKEADAVDDEVQKDVQGTYDNLRQMVANGDGGTFYDQRTRVKLAENFMYNAMEPTFIDQGPASNSDWEGHGTCWIASGEIWGMTQHPGAMADYLKNVALHGQITTKNGGEGDNRPQTYTFSKNLLTFRAGQQETSWTIEDRDNQIRMGYRSPVSKIFQYTLPMLSGSRPEGKVDGGVYSTFDFTDKGHTRGTRDILYMVTGDVPLDKGFADHSPGHLLNGNKDFNLSMAEKGSILTYTQNHLRSQTVRKVNDKWYLIQDDQHGEKEDEVLAQITDIERWAKGDTSVERRVSISAADLLHSNQWRGSGAADRLGAVIPGQASKENPYYPSDTTPSPAPRPNPYYP